MAKSRKGSTHDGNDDKLSKNTAADDAAVIRRGVNPRQRVYAPSGGDKITQAAHALDTNIHAILSRFTTSGILPNVRHVEYGDQPEADFQEAMFANARLKSAYESLPDEERSQTTFADFLQAAVAGLESSSEDSSFTPADSSALDDESKADMGASPSDEGASKNSERERVPEPRPVTST